MFGKRTVQPPPRILPAGLTENRNENRQVMQAPGLIYPRGAASGVACLIIDQSLSGVGLLLREARGNPFVSSSSVGQTFRLAFRVDRLEADCQVIWVDGQRIGGRLLSGLRPLQPKN